MEEDTTLYALEVVRNNDKKNPCGNCEEIDCEGCEYFDNG